MYSLGIDIGYSSISVVLVDQNNKIIKDMYRLHHGEIKQVLTAIINELPADYKQAEIFYGMFTGSSSKFIDGNEQNNFTNEVTAIIEGAAYLAPNAASIIEIGGQSAKYITNLNSEDKSRISISINSSCSAGTGSFLEEQMSRLNLKPEDYSLYADKGKSIPRIAGRCSVFAKTDIIHHQQEGVPVEDILLGLAHAMVKNYRVAVIKRQPIQKPVLFAGGVAYNRTIIDVLKKELNLGRQELIIPDHFSCIGALGAAVTANKEKNRINIQRILDLCEQRDTFFRDYDYSFKLPPLLTYGENDGLDKHIRDPLEHDNNTLRECYLGIDVGSTSTNLALVDRDNRIVCFKYLRTMGNPVKAVIKGLGEIRDEAAERIKIIGAGVTGSGRHMTGRLVGADVIKDEITSQAKAAVTIDSEVDTIFEIGGQDSKYISLKDGNVTDFQMNKICAAGTGSFIEEQAAKFNIPVNDFGNIALAGKNPVNLGERCTVFMESSIAACLSDGAEMDDIAAGLSYSIVKNYLNRVVGGKKIGNKIFFQGAVAYNQGVVNAFRAMTEKQIHVPRFFSITGAYGVAILAKEEMKTKQSAFKGFDIQVNEMETFRPEKSGYKSTTAGRFNTKIQSMIFDGYEGLIDRNKKTVGIPRTLFTYGMFPMFHEIFKDLGLNVILSDPSNENTIRLGQEYSLDETCYPVKLINGHVAELVEKKVDYIFFPDLYTVMHPGSHTRKDFGCAYMQLAFKLVSRAMDLKNKGIELLAPTIAFSLGKDFMMKSFLQLGKQLGKTKDQTLSAFQKGMKSFLDFEKRMEKNTTKMLRDIGPDEKVIFIVSKIYGVADPLLNLGIPDMLIDKGYKVFPLCSLPELDISKTHPNMYWPFSKHILETGRLIKRNLNFYGIFLSHHGCGPDSVTSHFFNEIMAGKPYLNIEVDEHSSCVGVVTRIEAFLNCLDKMPTKKSAELGCLKFERSPGCLEEVSYRPVKITTDIHELKKSRMLYLPNLYPYSDIFAGMLVNKGFKAEVMQASTPSSVDTGRRHTLTNEYLSLAVLLGDVFKSLENNNEPDNSISFFIPQTEGAEVDGQYARMVRTKLDQEGLRDVDIFSPFIEDTLFFRDAQMICLGLIAGDIIRNADGKNQNGYLDNLIRIIETRELGIGYLQEMAKQISIEQGFEKNKKRIMVIGEPWIVYNNFLSASLANAIEEKGHKILYSPLSECMWMVWKDFLQQNNKEDKPAAQKRLDDFGKNIKAINDCLSVQSPFENDLNDLFSRADKTVGYYAGANGRYRAAKALCNSPDIHGIITVSSTYENTGISLDILNRGITDKNPVLNLTFDGNRSGSDQTKLDAFIRYL